MKASLLSIGDELLIGQILNSNTHWISEQLTDLGVQVNRHLTVGDKEAEIHSGLQFSLKDSECLIIGGGLGPTHDDLTLSSLSSYFKIPLHYDQNWIEQVEAFFKARNRVMSENNKKQGYLLKDAIRIDNDCGTAAGQHLQIQGLDVFVVPGVPHEMKSMMSRYILPYLQKKMRPSGEQILKRTLLTTGLGESLLATRLDPLVKKIKADSRFTLAFLPNNVVVKLRLQMLAQNKADSGDFDTLIQELREACKDDYFGEEPETLENIVIQKLIQHSKTLSLAESCTGGLIAHRLTQIPGASKALKGSLVCYQEGIKTLELGIQEDSLKKQGVVSEATAIQMAEAIRVKWGSDFGVSTTGYLGPTGGDSFASVGTVWLALSNSKETITRKFQYEAHRERSKERAAQSALDLIRRFT